MHIHLADGSPERGQYLLAAQELHFSGLLSYAYKSCEKDFSIWWNELLNLHLAGLPSRNSEIQSQGGPEIESHLTTYADPHEVKIKEEIFMNLHLADTTAKLHGKTNIKLLLPEEEKNEHLFSYAYEQHEPLWKESWIPSTNIHLAGHSANTETEEMRSAHPSHLATFANKKEIRDTIGDRTDRIPDLRPRVIIDSGAFTAFTTGKAIDPRDYAKWSLDFKLRWEGKMQALHFMNLDVIGDQEASWVNQTKIEALGLNVLPIVTYGADKKHLIRAIENYKYIALGGLVPWSRQKDKLKAWLDYCFSIAMAQHKKTGVMPRIHLLGITQDWVLKRYPCYSSDSSSWVSCLRFGGGAAAGLKQLPRYKESEAALSATIHTLRCEIQKYKKMQDDATNLWTKRGVIFND